MRPNLYTHYIWDVLSLVQSILNTLSPTTYRTSLVSHKRLSMKGMFTSGFTWKRVSWLVHKFIAYVWRYDTNWLNPVLAPWFFTWQSTAILVYHRRTTKSSHDRIVNRNSFDAICTCYRMVCIEHSTTNANLPTSHCQNDVSISFQLFS